MTDRQPEPTTEAGRHRHKWHDRTCLHCGTTKGRESRRITDTRVYQRGRADALREAADRVRALDTYDDRHTDDGDALIPQMAALAILDPEAS